jgi:hypothetical protein
MWIFDRLLRHRPRLDTLLLRGAVGSSLLAALAGLAFEDWRIRRLLAIYTAPLLLAGLLWLRLRLRSMEARGRPIMVLDLVVFSLGMARFGTGELLPYSGHTLFLTYATVTTSEGAFRLFSVLLLLGTSYFKLWIWRDPHSWIWGLGLGFSAALLALALERRAEAARRSPGPARI